MGGKVYLVGCGPGSPDLLTIRAVEVLKRADVVVYDRLIDPSVVGHARRAKKVYCGKRGGESFKQGEINELLYKAAKQGKLVVRLKNGDPMVFGRGGEELRYLRERGIEVEVVPGLPSVTSLPSLAKVPLTQRGISSSLTILTGHRAGSRKLRWRGLGDTVVVLMGLGNLNSVVAELTRAGKRTDAPCMLICDGSTVRERFFITSLGKVAKAARRLKLEAPGILVVGDVVRSSLDFRGRRVAAFRSSDEAAQTRKLIENARGKPSVFEICDIVPSKSRTLKRALGGKWDAIVFMSPSSVMAAASLVDLRKVVAVAVGRRTERELRRFGCERIWLPKVHGSGGVEQLLKKRRWRKVLALRSSLAKEGLKGAVNVVAYSIRPKNLEGAIVGYINDGVDFTLLMSAGLLRLLLEAAEKRGLRREFIKKMNKTFVISLGSSITEAALANGIWVNYELEEPSLESLFRA